MRKALTKALERMLLNCKFEVILSLPNFRGNVSAYLTAYSLFDT
jgi:hypothetical protein